MSNSIPWVMIVKTDLYPYLVGRQVDAIDEKALATDQLPRFYQVMVDTVAIMRNQIASVRTNLWSETENTVPPELKQTACYLIIEALQAGIVGLSLTEDQKRCIEEAHEIMRRVERGEIKVSMPDDPINPPVQRGPVTTLIEEQDMIDTGRRKCTLSQMEGL